MKIPLQAARRNDDKFLLKFRPTFEGDYLIILKNYMGQPMLGNMNVFPERNTPFAFLLRLSVCVSCL